MPDWHRIGLRSPRTHPPSPPADIFFRGNARSRPTSSVVYANQTTADQRRIVDQRVYPWPALTPITPTLRRRPFGTASRHPQTTSGQSAGRHDPVKTDTPETFHIKGTAPYVVGNAPYVANKHVTVAIGTVAVWKTVGAVVIVITRTPKTNGKFWSHVLEEKHKMRASRQTQHQLRA